MSQAAPGVLVFHIPSYGPFAEAMIGSRPGLVAGELVRREFPDGEVYLRVGSAVRGRHVALVGGTVTAADTLEIYDLACAFAKFGARSVALVVPYFGYSTMERAVRPGEVVTAKTRARLLSSIPHADTDNRVILLDLHAEGVTHYFEGDIVPHHVSARPVVLGAIRSMGGTDPVLACTDAGRAKWVQSLANELGVDPAFVYKKRVSDRVTEITAVSAQVEGREVVIYDDMVRTGSSLVRAAEAYRAAGAVKVAAVATHAVLPGDSLARIRSAGVLDRLVVTDSHPRARQLADGFLEVVSVATLLADEVLGVLE